VPRKRATAEPDVPAPDEKQAVKPTEQGVEAPGSASVGDVQEGAESGAPVVEGPDAPDVDVATVSRALTFRLDEQLFGLPIEQVQEIQQIVELMPLPDSAPALVGMLDIRGSVVPAIDLRTLVGMPHRDYGLETPMVMCRAHGRLVCLIVDAVEDVVDVPSDCIQAASRLYSLADRMIGVCRLPQGMVMLLDLDRLVPDAALEVAEEAGGEAS